MRKRFKRVRARNSSSFRARRGRSSSSLNPMSLIVGGALYGAVRQYASNALQPVTSMIPLGNIADEVVLGTAGYLLATKTSGMLKDVGRAALTIEAARIGEAIISGQVSLGNASQSTTSAYVYG